MFSWLSKIFFNVITIIKNWFSPTKKTFETSTPVVADTIRPNADERFDFDMPDDLHQQELLVPDAVIEQPEKSYHYKVESPKQDVDIQNLDKFLNKILSSYDLTGAYQQERQNNPSNMSICILGMGPTGLLAAFRAYASGASVILIDKRHEYTRENVLRISQNTLYDSILKPIFRNHQIIENYLLSLNIIISFNLKTGNVDNAFAGEENGVFYTISTHVFEEFLYRILLHLQKADQKNIVIYRGVHISQLQPENGLIFLEGQVKPIQAQWIVNATGANGRLNKDTSIIDALFPKTSSEHYKICSSFSAYATATFDDNGHIPDRTVIIRKSNHTLPAAYISGAEILKTKYPQWHTSIDERINAYYKKNSRLFKPHHLNEQRVCYGFQSKQSYLESSYFGDINGDNIDLACVYWGTKDTLEKMQVFGWSRTRLPLVRQLNATNTVYVGMEIPVALLNTLISENISKEEKDDAFKCFIMLSLTHFMNKNLLEKLSIREGSAFSYQMRTCNKIRHRYDSGVEVFNLGDALAPPHFLTGSGLEFSAISILHWIDYLFNKDEQAYDEHIRQNVQLASVHKVTQNLREMGLFSRVFTELCHHITTQSLIDLQKRYQVVKSLTPNWVWADSIFS